MWKRTAIFQILNLWRERLPSDFNVNDLIGSLKNWKSEGYLKIGVWQRLGDVIDSKILPSLLPNDEGTIVFSLKKNTVFCVHFNIQCYVCRNNYIMFLKYNFEPNKIIHDDTTICLYS